MKVEPTAPKVLLMLSLMLLSGQLLQAQIVNDGATLTINSGLTIYIEDDFENKPAGTIDNQGTIEVRNDWNNFGTQEIDNLVRFTGTSNQNLNGNTTFEDIDIDNPSSVTFNTGTQELLGILTLEGGTLNTNGNLRLLSDFSRTAMIDDFTPVSPGSINGNITMERYVFSNGQRFHQIGSAVNALPVSELSELNLYGPDGGHIIALPTCDPSSIDPNSPYGNLLEMHEDGPFPNNCDQEVWYVRSAGNLENGRGYAAIMNGPVTLDMTGAPNTGTINYPNLQNTNAIGDGFQLVSNPFPSPIIWTAPPGFDGQAHLLQSFGLFTGTFQPILSSMGESITSSQGFQVRVSGAPADFVLTNADRTRTDAPFFKNSAWYEDLLVFEIEGNGFADKTTIYFHQDPTNAWDAQHDAHKLTSNLGQPTLYTEIDNYSEHIAINGLPLLDHPMSIPMGLIPGATGSFEITAKELQSFEATALVFLEDKKEQILQVLNDNPTYSFAADATDDAERFVVHFLPPAIINGVDANCVGMLGEIQIDMGVNTINGNTLFWDDYTVTDDNGTVVASGSQVNGNLALSGLQPGNYTLTLNMGNYQATETIVISGVSIVQSSFSPSTVSAYVGETIQFDNQSTGATLYDWDFGDGTTIIGTLNPTHSYTAPGTYDVKLKAANSDCADESSISIEVNKVSTGIIAIDPSNDFAVHRLANEIFLQFDFEMDEQAQLSIFDLLGREVYNSTVRTKGVHRITSFDHPDAYYIIKLTTDNESFNKKELLIRGK